MPDAPRYFNPLQCAAFSAPDSPSLPALNPPQLEAVTHTGSPLLVLAGAGSGKTRVITHRIAWLLNERAISPSDIAAVTFTNKAAREMKDRVRQMLGGDDATSGLSISTFHALGMKMLRTDCGRVGLRPGFSILDPRDIGGIVGELIRESGVAGVDQAERVCWKLSDFKNQGLTPEDALAGAGDPVSRIAAAVFGPYQRYLRACNAVDLDDLLLLPVALLKQEPERLRYWQLRHRFLLVDEYQDTNEVAVPVDQAVDRRRPGADGGG